MFFHTRLLISTLLAVSFVLAGPCDGLGTGAYSDISNFRVAAFHPYGENDHPYGIELVQDTTGVTSGASSTTFTAGSWDSNSVKDYDMVNGGIAATPPNWNVATYVSDNDVPFFYVSGATPRPTPVEVWCAVPNNTVTGEHEFDYLAAHGRYDLWSLCYKKWSETSGAYRVAYNVDRTKNNTMFDVGTCAPVYLTIVPN